MPLQKMVASCMADDNVTHVASTAHQGVLAWRASGRRFLSVAKCSSGVQDGIRGGFLRTFHRRNWGEAKISMSGPADAWFGVGLNAQVMSDSPYTLVVNYLV